MTEVSVVVPAHNAGSEFWHNMNSLYRYLQQTFPSVELVIAEDGSTDNTAIHADMLAKRHDDIQAVHASAPLGKGGGILHGFDESDGDILAFIDADLAPSLDSLPAIINPIRNGVCDAAVGSRYLSEAQSARPEERQLLSSGYNSLVQWLFNSQVADHQCGCKALRRDVYDTLRPLLRSRDFFWDTELLVRLQQGGFEVLEVPIEWTPQSESTVNVFRDPPRMVAQLVSLWVRTGRIDPKQQY